ncbi:XRE family transcriptional regulator [Sporolactobacillus sp. THM7-7]|nr:XRE family transcriptional regulator [Sporolactobacillus sp. THM7-7]
MKGKMKMKTLDYQNLNVSILLKNEREKRFLTFEDVGAGVGVSASYIFRIEKGMVTPSQKVVSQLIKYFGLETKDLSKYPQETVKRETSPSKETSGGI